MTVDKETAKEEYQRFLEKNWLECDDDDDDIDIDVNEKRDAAKDKSLILRAIRKGWLTIDDEGVATYTPQRSMNCDPITFYSYRGDTLSSMDKRKPHEEVTKIYVSLGAMTRTNAKRFSTMEGKPDLQTCLAIYTTFLV
jgi:hypothetical protein